MEYLELQLFETVLKTDISECWYCYLRGSHRLNGSIFTATNQTTLGRDPQKYLVYFYQIGKRLKSVGVVQNALIVEEQDHWARRLITFENYFLTDCWEKELSL